MANKGFTRIPDDGVGKRLPHAVEQHLHFENEAFPFSVDQVVTFSATLTVTGTIIHISSNGSAGTITIRIEGNVPNPMPTFTVGENIIVGGITHATIQSLNGVESYYPEVVTVGANMRHKWEIDAQGSAQVRFLEGTLHFDAYGKLQTSTQHKIAEYIMSYNELGKDFSDTIVGAPTLLYDNNKRNVTLTNGITALESYTRTSDEYHVYQTGISQLIEMTAACGDLGKTGLQRMWGYYDDFNGVMFAQSFDLAAANGGTSGMGIMLRTNATGSIVGHFIPQEEWNVDRVDGSENELNGSKVTLDPLQKNVYWMDFQIVGTTRFGIVVGGERIVCHKLDTVNDGTYEPMSTGTLPVSYHQTNTATTIGSSEFRMWSSSVFTEGAYNPFKRAFTTPDAATQSITGIVSQPILAIRPSEFYKTFINRSTIYPLSFSVHNAGSTPVMFELYRNGTTTDGAWITQGGESVADLNTTCTAFTGGSKRKSEIIGAGATVAIPFPAFEQNRRGLRRSGTAAYAYSRHVYCARLLSGTVAGDVSIILNWEEVRD